MGISRHGDAFVEAAFSLQPSHSLVAYGCSAPAQLRGSRRRILFPVEIIHRVHTESFCRFLPLFCFTWRKRLALLNCSKVQKFADLVLVSLSHGTASFLSAVIGRAPNSRRSTWERITFLKSKRGLLYQQEPWGRAFNSLFRMSSCRSHVYSSCRMHPANTASVREPHTRFTPHSYHLAVACNLTQ
jgi:hypothetical protein